MKLMKHWNMFHYNKWSRTVMFVLWKPCHVAFWNKMCSYVRWGQLGLQSIAFCTPKLIPAIQIWVATALLCASTSFGLYLYGKRHTQGTGNWHVVMFRPKPGHRARYIPFGYFLFQQLTLCNFYNSEQQRYKYDAAVCWKRSEMFGASHSASTDETGCRCHFRVNTATDIVLSTGYFVFSFLFHFIAFTERCSTGTRKVTAAYKFIS